MRASLRLVQPESCLILDATFVSFESPSETHPLTWPVALSVPTHRPPKSSLCFPGFRSGLLSWGCQRSPPSFSIQPVHSRQIQIPKDLSSDFDSHLPKRLHVPFLPFLPTSTVYSRLYFAGLLHPAADHGVHHLSGCFSRLQTA